MNRLRRFLFVAALAGLLAARPAAAQSTSPVADQPTIDIVLTSLALALEDQFMVEGEIELSYPRYDASLSANIVHCELLNPPSRLVSQMVLPVALTAADGTVTRRSVVVIAQHWRNGYALRESVSLRTPVSISALELRRYDALRTPDALQLEEGAELDFARNLPGGRLLTWRDVIRRPLVRRNEAVEVIATDGTLTVTLRAIALQDAARGESVRVRNPDTRKEFVATVSDPSRAFVRF